MNPTDVTSNEIITYMPNVTQKVTSDSLVNAFSGEINFDIPSSQVQQIVDTNVPTEITSSNGMHFITTCNIMGEETIVDFSNNQEDYDKLKIFRQLTGDDGSEDISSIVKNEQITKVASQSNQLSLEQKIMQDGLQKTIDQLSDVEDTIENPEQYKINSVSGTVSIGSIKTDDDNQMFATALANLPFQTDASNLMNDTAIPGQIVSSGPSEAVELAIASEEEMPSPWIDVMALATAPALRTQSWSELNAFPTAVHSLVDLAGPEPYPLDVEHQLQTAAETLDTVAAVEAAKSTCDSPIVELGSINSSFDKPNGDITRVTSDKNRRNRNILQEITADADICRCVDCKCDQVNNCQNCSQSSVETATVNHKKAENPLQLVSEIVSSLQSGCPCEGISTGGCGSCCVVICLKTLQQLQRVFNNRNCCRETSRSQCCKDKTSNRANVTFGLLKSQVANNQ